MVGSDEHGQPFVQVFGTEWIVERVEHLVVGYAVLPGTWSDEGVHYDKVPWGGDDCKLTCQIGEFAPTSTSHTEHMGTLEFIASLVHSLAWPVAAVVAILILRAPLARALSGPVKRWKAGPSGVEVEYWDETIEAVRVGLRHQPEVGPVAAELPGLDDELTRLVEVSPRAAVMEAFARIERVLSEMLAPEDADGGRPVGPVQLARVLRARGSINDETLNAVQGMAVLRNLAAHGADDVDTRRAAEFIALADAVLFSLRRPDR